MQTLAAIFPTFLILPASLIALGVVQIFLIRWIEK